MTDRQISTSTDVQNEALASVLANAVAFVANEALMLAQYEAAQTIKFGRIWPENDNGAFGKLMGQIEVHLGGPPEFYLLQDGEKAPVGDNYPNSALREAVDVFTLARKSVIRAHMFMTGSGLLSEHPEIMELSKDPKIALLIKRQAIAAFWEHAEAAYIRLYSYWDRVGQILDFAFFNIRKFDQNGFNAVMDRIHANAVPMSPILGASQSWKRLRDFQTSAKDDGLKWLLQRRNLIVHSLHLHPLQADDDDVFKSQFNHLDVAHREKLRPREISGEAEQLLVQLDKATELFRDCLAIVQLSPSRRNHR